jgi:hypothetical protein
MEQVYSVSLAFLIRVQLVKQSSMLQSDISTYVECSLNGFNRIIITPTEDMINMNNLASMDQHDLLLLIAKDYTHAKELLTYNNTSVLNLMSNNILLVHMTGMLYSLSTTCKYCVTHIMATENNAVNRRNILNLCNSDNINYSHMSQYQQSLIKPNCLFYHRSIDPLETVGVEYLFSIFKISNNLLVDPSKLIYIFRLDSTVNVVQIHT